MLYDFLLENQDEILAMTEKKSLDLAGIRPSSEQLKRGLPIFYGQLTRVLQLQRDPRAAGHWDEVELAKAAGIHGTELLRLGYTLSHVVHAYGAMCQSITELATAKNFTIAAGEIHDLNRCLDIAIANAVTEYQSLRNNLNVSREVEHLGFLAHELRNALTSANVSLQLIKNGTVGFGGSTGQILERSMHRIGELVDRSLTEVRLRVDPKVHIEPVQLLQLVDQIAVTAEVEAHSRNQHLEIQIDPTLVFEADQQLAYSAVSNLIQNAVKYTHAGGKIQVRGSQVGPHVIVEVEDECGGLLSDDMTDLFKPFVQKHENRNGMGLGLTIAQRAVALIHGTIEALNIPGRGCIFKVRFPKTTGLSAARSEPAA